MKRNCLSISFLLACALLFVPQIAGAQMEGIKVHGDWTIVVKEADGTVVSRHEFRNALVEGGSVALSSLLSGQFRAGTWQVWLMGTAGPCGTPSAAPTSCFIREATDDAAGSTPFVFYTLTRAVVGSTLVLEGTARTRPAAWGDDRTGVVIGSLSHVTTMLVTCGPDADATSCKLLTPGATQQSFTAKQLADPITLTSRQLIEVKVTLSFQ